MKINKIVLAIIAASAVLAVSPAVLAQTDTNKPAAEARARPRGGMMTVEQIDKAVTLTDAQKPKVKAALEEFRKNMEAARAADSSERRTKMTTARQDFNKQMKEILTPEQYTKFESTMPRGRRGGAGGGGQNPAGQ